MNIQDKFNTAVIISTCVLMYFGLTWIANDTDLPSKSFVGGLLISALASIGTYILISRLLRTVLKYPSFLNRRFLGPSYIEGSWVGFLQDDDEAEKVYLVTETYEQDLDQIVISGNAYTLEGKQSSKWTSKMCNLDAEKGKIVYTFACTSDMKGVSFDGVGEFKLCRTAKTDASCLMEGNVYDFVSDSKKSSIVHERKLPDTVICQATLFKAAQEYYREFTEQFGAPGTDASAS